MTPSRRRRSPSGGGGDLSQNGLFAEGPQRQSTIESPSGSTNSLPVDRSSHAPDRRPRYGPFALALIDDLGHAAIVGRGTLAPTLPRVSLRICFVTPFAWSQPHEVNAHVDGAAAALRRLGHEVTVLAPSSRARDLLAGPRALQRGVDAEVIAVGPSIPISRRTNMGVPVGVRANLALALTHGPLRRRPRLRARPSEPLVPRAHLDARADRGDVLLGRPARLPGAALATGPPANPGRRPPRDVRGDGRAAARALRRRLRHRPARGRHRALPPAPRSARDRGRARGGRPRDDARAAPPPRRRAGLGGDLLHTKPLGLPARDPARAPRRDARPVRAPPRAARRRCSAGGDLRARARRRGAARARGGRVRGRARRRTRHVAALAGRSAMDDDAALEARGTRGRAAAETQSFDAVAASSTRSTRGLAGSDASARPRRTRTRSPTATGSSSTCTCTRTGRTTARSRRRTSSTTPEEIGLGGIAVTDHNVFGGALEAVELARGRDLVVIPGEEVKTDGQGEVIGLFLEEEIPRGMSFADTIAAIRDQGGLVYLPHPFDRLHAIPDPATLHRHLAEIDVFEVFNAGSCATRSTTRRCASRASTGCSRAPARTRTSSRASAPAPSGCAASRARRSSSSRSARPRSCAARSRSRTCSRSSGWPRSRKRSASERRVPRLRARRRAHRRDLRALPQEGHRRDQRARRRARARGRRAARARPRLGSSARGRLPPEVHAAADGDPGRRRVLRPLRAGRPEVAPAASTSTRSRSTARTASSSAPRTPRTRPPG